MHHTDTCLARMRVLVVEDEPTCRDTVRTMLQSAGAAVTPVASAEEAIEQMTNIDFDALISDIRLDGLDGIGFLKQIRSEGNDIPVIIITGFASLQSAISAIQLGADDYLLKPITKPDSLVRATRNAIDKLNLRTQNAMLRCQLQETELSFKTVFDHTADMIFLFPLRPDRSFDQMEQCNLPAVEALGYSDSDMRRMTLLDLLARSHRKVAHKIMGELHASHSCSFDTLFVRADGSHLPAELSCHVLPADHQVKIIVIARNIAGQVEAESRFANKLEEERARIGRELHDAVCQDLASIHMVASTNTEPKDIDSIMSAAASAMTSARNLSKNLLPVFETPEDLCAAAEDLLETHKQRHGIDYTFSMAEPVSVSTENGLLHLFRIIQEAANNSVKHGKAANISVTLESDDGLYSLRIADDGTHTALDTGKGIGTLIMRQRARILGASLHIFGNEKGTTVKCCWQNGDNGST